MTWPCQQGSRGLQRSKLAVREIATNMVASTVDMVETTEIEFM